VLVLDLGQRGARHILYVETGQLGPCHSLLAFDGIVANLALTSPNRFWTRLSCHSSRSRCAVLLAGVTASSLR
jgi:hypothetical protein